MNFLVYPIGYLQNHSENLIAYFRNADGSITAVEPVLDGNMLSFPDETIDFANLNMSCPLEGYGTPLISTGSLENRNEPYLLPIELARGKISSLRNLLQEWGASQDDIPQEFHQLHEEAYQLFTKAIFHKENPEKACELAWDSLGKVFKASEFLCQFYVKSQLKLVSNQNIGAKHFGVALDTQLSGSEQIQVVKDKFSRVCVPVKWNEIEKIHGERNWDQLDSFFETCRENSIRCYSGPLFDLSEKQFPAWLKKWQTDFENFISIVCDYVESVVGRYSDQVKVWNIARSYLSNEYYELSQRDHLTVVAHALNTARQIQKDLLLGVSVVHPWGISSGCCQMELSPLYAIDMLQRSGVGLSWVSLEIPMGYKGKKYVPYDLMELSRLIDEWAVVELPLDIVLAYPSYDQFSGKQTEGPSEEKQKEFLEYLMPALIEKHNVMSVTWAGLADCAGMKFPHSGLLKEDGSEKPALSTFASFCSQYGPEKS